MPRSIPAGIADRRGLKGALLRRLPKAWLQVSGSRRVKVPPFAPPRANGIDIGWHTGPVAAVELTWALSEISADLCVGPVNVAAKTLGPFRVEVFGTIYQSCVQHLEGQRDCVIGTGSSADRPPQSTSLSSPYSHLYGLLYPPPDEVIDGQISLPDELYDYQRAGIQFLVEREHALLADDMGLGKTAQCVLALAVLRRTERLSRALIVCPRAVIRQWQQEARRWACLHVTVVDGSPTDRRRLWKHAPGVLLTTPNLVLNDRQWVQQSQFDLVVCDDVGPLKSPGKTTAAIRDIPRIRSWCLNGTPLENKPEDFANVMEFAHPGLFSASERLKAPARSELQERVKPFFLRRRRTDHLDLPDKVSIGPIEIDLRGRQLEEYRRVEQLRWQALEDSSGRPTKWHIFRVIT